MEQAKILEGEKPDFKKFNNDAKAVQIQRPKEPSELQQVYVRKLMTAIQTVLTDFSASEKKCNTNQKEEKRVAAEIEKAHCKLGSPPKLDSPEFIRWKELRWEQTILLACNQYFTSLNQFKIENEEFVSTLKKFHSEMKRVLNRLVAVQPLPESMKSKEKAIMTNSIESGTAHNPSTVIEVVSAETKTEHQGKTEIMEARPVVLSAKQIRLREKYGEAALNPLVPENAEVVIYTDGSLISTNINTEEKIESGGYAAILIFRKMGDAEIMISGHKARPSNAEYMELLAISKALKRLKKYNIKGKVVLYCDALGVVNKYNTHLAGWQDCGWKRADGKYIRYWKLWKKIRKNSKKIDLRVCWVKGHAESELNQRCDEIARAEAKLRAV